MLRKKSFCIYSEAAGEYGSRTLYKMLGYFSIIGLLRVHCLLGDYTLALKMMDNIELNKKVNILFLNIYILILIFTQKPYQIILLCVL